ncbi:MAG: tetratricopeptide repeat protein [Pseudomonadota bacterium]
MQFPFSTNEIKKGLKTDTGFKAVIDSLPKDQGDLLKNIIANESFLTNALESLPEKHRDQITQILNDIINVPQQAMRLYEQCRYFEARKLLLKTIDLYTYVNRPSLEALDKATEFVTKRIRALCYDLLGDVEWVLGNSAKAGQHHQLALELAEETGDLDTTVKALQGLGTYYLEMGDFQKGMEYCQKAMELISGQDDRWSIGQKILTTLSILSSDTDKDLDAALEYALKAVDLCTQKEDKKALPICLNNLACLYLEAEELDLAVETLENALEITHQEDDLRHEALILNNLAICVLRGTPSGDHIEWAASLITKALSISSDIGAFSLQALSIGNMGFVYQLSDRANEARKAFLDAVKIHRRIGSKSSEAAALINLGWHLKEYLGDFEGACQSCRKAIELIEDIRGGLKKESHRINYADKVTDPYQLVVDCLVNLNRVNEALEYVERSKSRALLDLLAGKLIDRISVESDPEAFHRAVTLLGEIDEIQKNLTSIYRKEQVDNTTEHERAIRHEYEILSNSLLDELSEKERAFEETFAELLELDPEKASILKESALPVNQIQGLIDDDALFLELYQTEEKLQLFIIPQSR